ncbi:hypothetical protein C0993_004950 [Termitomyces sp. T159_Od127]|nr:hypothetical protein C0993_004950 [Termitomyces sp. T159_Od127]
MPRSAFAVFILLIVFLSNTVALPIAIDTSSSGLKQFGSRSVTPEPRPQSPKLEPVRVPESSNPESSTKTKPAAIISSSGIKDAKTDGPTDGEVKKKGSYAILTPGQNYLLYDNKFDTYFVFFKFGDTNDQTRRNKDYATANPSAMVRGKKDPNHFGRPGPGKTMENMILKVLFKKLGSSGLVERVRTEDATGVQARYSEWYKFYLGRTKEKAFEAKARLTRLVEEYSTLRLGEVQAPTSIDEKTSTPARAKGKSQAPVGKSNEAYRDDPVRQAYIKKFFDLFSISKDQKSNTKTVIDKSSKGPEQRDWRNIAKLKEVDS